jgi:aspartate racemase
MKTLGIIGGLGPESTVDYYQRIIALFRERTGDRHYPEFVVVSVDLRKGLDFIDANDLSGMANYLLGGIDKLARAGADFGIISANTPHIVFDEVAPKSPIPLISIVEATRTAAKMQNLKQLALFGTRYTMQSTFYPKVFARDGIELLVPALHDQDYIHDKYMNELVLGKFLPETRAGLLAVVDRLKDKIDIDGVILAGTELPLILRDDSHNGIPLLDTTKIHTEAAVTEMLS